VSPTWQSGEFLIKIQTSEKTKQFLSENTKVTFREKVHLKNKGEMDTFFLGEI